MILDTVNKRLEVVLTAAVATNELPIVVGFGDTGQMNIGSFIPGSQNTATTGTSTVVILTAPEDLSRREVRFLSIFNADTAAAIVTLKYDDTATERQIVKITLQVGDTLLYTHTDGFSVIDATGQKKSSGLPFWLNEIENGRGFAFSAEQAATLNEFSHIQLLNPSGSGVVAVVKFMAASLGVIGRVTIATFDTALTTLVATGPTLNLGGTASKAEVRKQSNASVLGTAVEAYDLQDTKTVVLVDDWHARLAEGKGILVRAETKDVKLLTNFRWREL